MTASDSPRTPGTVDPDLLRAYLVEHFLGSSPGIRAFEAAASTWEGTPTGAILTEATGSVREAREELRSLIEELGFRITVAEKGAAGVSQAAGRANPVNLLHRGQGALARIELETLTGMVRAQRCMWESLIALCTVDPRLDRARMERLATVARGVEDALAAELERTTVTGFAPNSDTALG